MEATPSASEVEALRAQIAQLEVYISSYYNNQLSIAKSRLTDRRAPTADGSLRQGAHVFTPTGHPQATLKEKEKALDTVHPYSRTYNKTSVSTILCAADGGRSLVRTAGPWDS